ncbi:acyltransferase [Protaetiibacter intestinalis]
MYALRHRCHLGPEVSIGPLSSLTFDDLYVGEGSTIGSECEIDAYSGIEIGSNATIGDRVRLLSRIDLDSTTTWASGIVIGDNAVVPDGSVILPGDRISGQPGKLSAP